MDLKECSILEFDADLAKALKKLLQINVRFGLMVFVKKRLELQKKKTGTAIQLDMFIDDDYLDTEWYR